MTTVTDIDLPRRIAARIYTGPTPADPLVNVPGYTNPTTGRTQRRCRACIRRQVRKES